MAEEIKGRKREILELAAQGKTDKEIAVELGISFDTVRGHWREIRQALGLSSRTEVVAKWLMESLHSDFETREDQRSAATTGRNASEESFDDLLAENQRLRELTKKQAEFLRGTIANTDRKVALLTKRLETLEVLNELTIENKVFIHSGEYGASWRKYFISDAVRFTGTTPEQWIAGEVNFFDLILPEYVVRNIPLFKPFEKGVHRLALTYGVKSDEGTRYMLDLLTCDILQEDGVGSYYGVTVDITDWADQIKEIVAKGWLDFE